MEALKTTITDYGEGIYAIDQQMVRAFLIVGSQRALLLDTGAVPVDFLSYVKQITELPLTVLLTHGDRDHIGNLQDFSDAYVHQKDMEAVLSHESCEKVHLHPLLAGDIFELGGRTLKVLFTPGHTAGSICLLDEENRLLFSGDTISYGPVYMFGDGRNMSAYIHTLRTLKQMKEEGVFTTVYCCHNTCPIPADTLEDLLACATGIQDGTIPGIPAQMPIQTDEKPFIGKCGKCSILFY